MERLAGLGRKAEIFQLFLPKFCPNKIANNCVDYRLGSDALDKSDARARSARSQSAGPATGRAIPPEPPGAAACRVSRHRVRTPLAGARAILAEAGLTLFAHDGPTDN